MCHAFVVTTSFFDQLRQIDDELAEQTKAAGCRWCGGRLHSAAYWRKPRGVHRCVLNDDYAYRHSFCCAVDGCRRRCTPPSVRFLGRRVYFAFLVVLTSSVSITRIVAISSQLSVPVTTLRRWRQWWQQRFCQLPGWAVRRLELVAPIDPSRLPESLWERFGALTPATLVALLRWLAPLLSTSGHAQREG